MGKEFEKEWIYVYFSICACNVFNLMIIVLYIGEKFSFCVFWVSSDIQGGVLSGCKIYPLYGYFSVGYLFVLLCLLKFT